METHSSLSHLCHSGVIVFQNPVFEPLPKAFIGGWFSRSLSHKGPGVFVFHYLLMFNKAPQNLVA